MAKIKIENIGGTGDCEVSGAFSQTEIYVALLDDFEKVGGVKARCGDAAAKNLTELVTIQEQHVFKSDCGFTRIKAIAETVKLEGNQLGDVNKSPIFENKLTFQLLGSRPEILGFKRYFKGRELVVLATEYGSGQVRQIGSAEFGAKFKEMSSLIDAPVEGENTSTIVVQDKQLYEAAIYNFDIELQPA